MIPPSVANRSSSSSTSSRTRSASALEVVRAERQPSLLGQLGEEPMRHRVVEAAEVLALDLVGALGLFPRAQVQAALQEVAVGALGEALNGAGGRPLAGETEPGERARPMPPRPRCRPRRSGSGPTRPVPRPVNGPGSCRAGPGVGRRLSCRWRRARGRARCGRGRARNPRDEAGRGRWRRVSRAAPGRRRRRGGRARPRAREEERTKGRARVPEPESKRGYDRTRRSSAARTASRKRRRSASWASRVVRRSGDSASRSSSRSSGSGRTIAGKARSDEARHEHAAEAEAARRADRSPRRRAPRRTIPPGRTASRAARALAPGTRRGCGGGAYCAKRTQHALEALAGEIGPFDPGRRGAPGSRRGSRPTSPSPEASRGRRAGARSTGAGCRSSRRSRSSSYSRASRSSRALTRRLRQAASPETMPGPRGQAIPAGRADLGVRAEDAVPRMRAEVRNSITRPRSRSAPTRSSSSERPRAAGSMRGTPSTKKASMPARSKAEARATLYAPRAAQQDRDLLVTHAFPSGLLDEPRDLDRLEGLPRGGEDVNGGVEARGGLRRLPRRCRGAVAGGGAKRRACKRWSGVWSVVWLAGIGSVSDSFPDGARRPAVSRHGEACGSARAASPTDASLWCLPSASRKRMRRPAKSSKSADHDGADETATAAARAAAGTAGRRRRGSPCASPDSKPLISRATRRRRSGSAAAEASGLERLGFELRRRQVLDRPERRGAEAGGSGRRLAGRPACRGARRPCGSRPTGAPGRRSRAGAPALRASRFGAATRQASSWASTKSIAMCPVSTKIERLSQTPSRRFGTTTCDWQERVVRSQRTDGALESWTGIHATLPPRPCRSRTSSLGTEPFS